MSRERDYLTQRRLTEDQIARGKGSAGLDSVFQKTRDLFRGLAAVSILTGGISACAPVPPSEKDQQPTFPAVVTAIPSTTATTIEEQVFASPMEAPTPLPSATSVPTPGVKIETSPTTPVVAEGEEIQPLVEESSTPEVVPTATSSKTPVSFAEVVKEGDFIYTVQPRDTLSGIAKKYGVSLDSLIQANPHISNINMLSVGQEVIIPGQEGLVSAVGGSEELTPTPVQLEPTQVLAEPTPTPQPEQAVIDESKPYLNQPLEYFQACSTGGVPLGGDAGSDFPGFKAGVPQGFNVFTGEFSWVKDYDNLLRFAILAFDASGNLITVAAEGESTAREFRTSIPRMNDIPNCKYYVKIIYDERWIPVSCGVMTKTD